MHMSTTHALTGERADLLESLARTRYFLRNTTRDLTDEQAAQRAGDRARPAARTIRAARRR
jgi:hypothetical protein